MRWLTRKIGSFLWWTYPRGSLEYDVIVALILAFIFLTPRTFFRDTPRPGPDAFPDSRLSAPAPPRPELPRHLAIQSV